MSTEVDSGMPAASDAGIYETQKTTTSEQATPLPEVTPTNAETMAAQALSKIKKQTQQIEETNRAVAQVSASLKKAEKGRVAQAKQAALQAKRLRSQIVELQQQLAKAKSTGKKSSGGKKKKKTKTKPKKR